MARTAAASKYHTESRVPTQRASELTGTGTASANISRKRKVTADGPEDVPAKRARTIVPVVNGTSKKTATATKPAAKATTKKAPAAKSGATTKKAAKATKVAAAKPAAKAASKKKASEPRINGVKGKHLSSEAEEDEDGADDGGEEEEEEEPKKAKAAPAKKAKVEKAAVAPKLKERKKGPVINERPSDILNVFVFGENSSGELGLGDKGNVIDVKRPRLNPLLKDKKVVAIAAGGMHQVFLTADGKILTCGVNDQGALGRDTSGAEKLRDVDASDSEDDDNGLNALEATPLEVDLKDVPEGTVFTSLAAGDSVTFAVTDEGLVYGCGTFRVSHSN